MALPELLENFEKLKKDKKEKLKNPRDKAVISFRRNPVLRDEFRKKHLLPPFSDKDLSEISIKRIKEDSVVVPGFIPRWVANPDIREIPLKDVIGLKLIGRIPAGKKGPWKLTYEIGIEEEYNVEERYERNVFGRYPAGFLGTERLLNYEGIYTKAVLKGEVLFSDEIEDL